MGYPPVYIIEFMYASQLNLLHFFAIELQVSFELHLSIPE